jgi:hypothetical protein
VQKMLKSLSPFLAGMASVGISFAVEPALRRQLRVLRLLRTTMLKCTPTGTRLAK